MSLAIIPTRSGRLPLGGAEAVAAAGGRAWLIGDDPVAAADELPAGHETFISPTGHFAPAGAAAAIAGGLPTDSDLLVVPGSPDGRDLAPRLAHHLGRPLIPWAIEVDRESAVVVSHDGRLERTVGHDGAAVVLLQPGAPQPGPEAGGATATTTIVLDIDDAGDSPVIASLPPDPATMDLADAARIVGAGAGLGGPADIGLLAAVGEAIGASLGATRVVTDAGWAGHERQIGTTGVAVDPDLYLAFAISGAVQHVMGLGDPDHVVTVNLDSSCPMMAMADLAVVADARAVLRSLSDRLGLEAADG